MSQSDSESLSCQNNFDKTVHIVFSFSLWYLRKKENNKVKFFIKHVVFTKFIMYRKPRVKVEPLIVIKGISYKKQIILADLKVPTKLSIDRQTNNLFFRINSDQYSDQNFHSVVLNLDTGLNAIIPSIRNGFASAVDPAGSVYLGGSDGIYRFNYSTRDVDEPGILENVDILDLYFNKYLYFVETSSQNVFRWSKKNKFMVRKLEGFGIQHFSVHDNEDIFLVNPAGVYIYRKGSLSPITFGCARNGHFRGLAVDIYGAPYLIAQDGIYSVDMLHRQIMKMLHIENAYGLAFDKDNNIIYSDERSVGKLIPQTDPILHDKTNTKTKKTADKQN